ncbi:MAG TPA: fused MFS/spermidine synthase [Longimicrobiales bacterium]|nr:fused MFS/spermidine synthase [Longimicrobiales bacterium]
MTRGLLLVLFAAVLLLPLLLLAPSGPTVLYEGESEFGPIRVTEDGRGVRRLYLGEGRAVQTAMRPDQPLQLHSPYTRVAMIGLGLAPADGRLLFVGLGGGAMPTYTRHVLPDARIDVVEIDPAVIDVAITWFGFRPDSMMTAHPADGRAFIAAAAPGTWDVIFLDAFSDDAVPYALATAEFLEAVQRSLAPGGVVVSNLWRRNALYDDMVATYRHVFPQVNVLGVPARAQDILVAGTGGVPDRAALVRGAAAVTTPGFDLPGLVTSGYRSAAGTGTVLRDR